MRSRLDFFSVTALPYDALTAQAVWRSHCREMTAHFPVQPSPWRVLDLGCGPANSSLAIAGEGAAHVVGVDLSRGMLRRGQRALDREVAHAGRVSLVHADARHLPFDGGVFDVVTGHSFLYLVADPAGVLDEAYRALRPGGRIVLLEPSSGFAGLDFLKLATRSLRFTISMIAWRLVSGRRRRYTPRSLRAALERAGFAHVAIERDLGGLGLRATGMRPVDGVPLRPDAEGRAPPRRDRVPG